MHHPEDFTYMTFTIRKHDTRYYQTEINGVVVTGSAEELVELIDDFLLKDL